MRIGIDFGGTKIEVIALDDDGSERFRRRTPTPRGDYAACVRAVVELVAAAETATASTGRVGIGIPGIVSPATGLVKNANSTWLNGRALHTDLSAALGRPVRLANDANCFALSEATDGAGAGAAVVFGVILGTGTGGGVVVHGRVLVGPDAVAGEWGHNSLPWPDAAEWPGPPCYCGRQGCIETFLSGSGLQMAYGGGDAPPADAIAAAAEAGEPAARRRSRFTCGASARRSPASSTSWIPTSSCSAEGCRMSTRCIPECPPNGPGGSFRIASTRAWCARATETPAACAGRRGCGRPEVRGVRL